MNKTFKTNTNYYIDIELFISKLMKKKEDFELLYQNENVKKDVIDQEILHLEKITNFFFAYVCCLELVLQPFSNVTPENLNLNEKENSSFFYMLMYINKLFLNFILLFFKKKMFRVV